MSIFISYAHEDAEAALSIYEMLDKKGFNPWIDKKNLLPGQDWALEIDKAIRNSHIFIACLSTNSVSQRGYFLAELKKAIEVLDTVPEEEVFLIPVRLDDCQMPTKIKHLHWLDYFANDGPIQLVDSITQHLGPPFEPEMILIPAGEFLMGSNPNNDKYARDNELPQHSVYIPEYYIGKYPVTNLQFQAFVEATGHPPTGVSHDNEYKLEHPVAEVSWEDATVYCRWLSETSRKPYRLPTEAEWEKAARGTDDRIYPWGNEWDPAKCNTRESKLGETSAVGQFSPEGDSPYGVADMAGNVLEWCTDWYDIDEYRKMKYAMVYSPQGPERGEYRVLRGGSFYGYRDSARVSDRYNSNRAITSGSPGFG